MANSSIVCLVAGRSGGHIIPAMAFARDYKKNHKILFFSTNSLLDRKICSSYKAAGAIDYYVALAIGNVPKSRLLKLTVFFWQCFVGLIKSFFYLVRFRPIKIISLGGYVSIPVCVAGWVLRIPVELVELNATPGKAVLLLAKIASKVNICFAQATTFFSGSCKVIPYPTRFGSTDIISKASAAQLLTKQLNIVVNPQRPTLLILGGSQGSQFINMLMIKFLDHYAHKLPFLQIFHQTGDTHREQIAAYYKEKQISAYIFDYSDEINRFYSVADLVLCRAGAGTLFELLFFQKNAIVIPLETGTTTHQTENAYVLSREHPSFITVMNQQHLEKDAREFFDKLYSQVS